jgi:hypothetical protein
MHVRYRVAVVIPDGELFIERARKSITTAASFALA